MTFIKDDAYVV